MTDDDKKLVKRLRKTFHKGIPVNPDGPEAADRIEALSAGNELLRAQLQAKEDGLNVRDRRIEAQAAEIERLRRDKDTLLTFTKAINSWRTDADSYDRECDHPTRAYCEDVELMERAAGYVLRRVTERAALEVKQ